MKFLHATSRVYERGLKFGSPPLLLFCRVQKVHTSAKIMGGEPIAGKPPSDFVAMKFLHPGIKYVGNVARL